MYLTTKQSTDKDFISELAGQALSTPIMHLKKLGGVISYNYEVNHHWIFKLMSSKTNPDDWLRQGAYMPCLQNHFSFEIPQPTAKTVYADGVPFLSLSYPKIEGKCFENTFSFFQKDFKFKVHFFEQLSDAANQIHSVSLDSLPLELPTKQDIFEYYYFKSFLKKEGTCLEKKLFKKLTYDPDLGLGDTASKTSLLAHSDLHAGNVVLNDKNQLIGILDFDSLGRGDRFWEFRPKLYQQPDINLFQTIYSEQTKHPVNPKDVNSFYQFYDSVGWFAILSQLYDCTKSAEQESFSKEFSKTFALMKAIKKSHQ